MDDNILEIQKLFDKFSVIKVILRVDIHLAEDLFDLLRQQRVLERLENLPDQANFEFASPLPVEETKCVDEFLGSVVGAAVVMADLFECSESEFIPMRFELINHVLEIFGGCDEVARAQEAAKQLKWNHTVDGIEYSLVFLFSTLHWTEAQRHSRPLRDFDRATEFVIGILRKTAPSSCDGETQQPTEEMTGQQNFNINRQPVLD
jgi:hypothetical protein